MSERKGENFRKFLQMYSIRIPIIQRDYAHGRENKKVERIIERFLKDIKKMFAQEHVKIVKSLFGIKYINPKTGNEMSKYMAQKYLSGNY